eukprot:1325582-Amorphochlora_amoeboformis.AAC.1
MALARVSSTLTYTDTTSVHFRCATYTVKDLVRNKLGYQPIHRMRVPSELNRSLFELVCHGYLPDI